MEKEDSRLRLPASAVCVTLASYFNRLSLSFLICNVMELIRSPTSQGFCENEIR